MSWLKRALHSLRCHWVRNVLVISLFTALFAAGVGCLVLFLSSRSQITFMQETVGRAVTLKTFRIWIKNTNRGAFDTLTKEEAEKFADSPQVESFNYASARFVFFQGAKPLYPEERVENEKYQVLPNDAFLYSPLESRTDTAFTVGGYRLLEGRHFTREETDVCLVSREFAEFNGFGLGDRFSIRDGKSKREDWYELEIVGIFQGPGSEYRKGTGSRPEELLFIPSQFWVEHYSERYEDGFPEPWSMTVFLKEGTDMEAFLQETQKKFNIVEVQETPPGTPTWSPPPEECALMTDEEFFEYYSENRMLLLQLNRDLYDRTIGPTESMNALAGGMTAAFLGASALVLVLTNMLFLKNKRREFGMLCAMGESKGKVVLQACVEVLVPMLAAMLLGLTVGLAAGVPLADSLGGGVYEQNAADAQGVNDLVTYAHRSQSGYSMQRVGEATWLDLCLHNVYTLVTPPKPEAQVDGRTIGLYFASVCVLAILALAMQAAAILRASPAKILAGKK